MSAIGRMNYKVWILELKESYPDGMGGHNRNKVKVKQCWAAVTELNEARAGATHNEETTQGAEFLIRAGSYKITVKNLIQYMGDEYNIHSVTTDHKRRITTVVGYAKG
jgi:SPP1 family predicted phage head-tail adaptor